MGRVRTHRAPVSSGWGPSGRWFKIRPPRSPGALLRLPEAALGSRP
jgi:hypothetical protein